MNGNGKSQRAPIERWETLEVLYSDTRKPGRDDLGILVEVQRPVFEGGRTGRVSLGVAIRRGERMLRLFCRDGATTEISELRDMLATLDYSKLDSFTDRFAELRLKHDPVQRERAEERGSRPNRGGPGSGLGPWSAPGKTERKRKKRSREQPDR